MCGDFILKRAWSAFVASSAPCDDDGVRRGMPCPAQCGYDGVNLEYHYRHSPFCRPVPVIASEPKKRARDCSESARVYAKKVTTRIGMEILRAHTHDYVKVEHLNILRNLIVQVASMIITFIKDEDAMGGVSLDTILEAANAPFNEMPPAETMITQRRKIFQRAIPRPVVGGEFDNDSKKGAVRFDALQLVTILLQECKGARVESEKSSELYKSGDLYGKKPNVVTDVIHGSRFYNWYQVCGKATPDQANDLRVVLHGWIDAFTPLDGLSQRARKHKYTVLLAALVNLPVRMRHYHDFLLLLLLYNNRYLKKHGGLVRALTGVGEDGTTYGDKVNLAIELELNDDDEPAMIELPNDADPAGDPVTRRLRLFLLVMSYDWLGSGEFGPWAESVSARHPCPKCSWAVKCPCAYLAESDERLADVVHLPYCKGKARRTHDEAMHVMHEMRLLAKTPRSKTKLAERMTQEGLFSLHSASDRLMRDVVKDATVDTMHWGACGASRYLFSWLTDVLIPDQFSWDVLNEAKNLHRFSHGARVPDLERSKGDKRGSTSTHLSSGEMLAFTLASPQVMHELVDNVRDEPPWQCWLAHVSHVRFVHRTAYDLARDVPECNRLQTEFLLAFGKVEQWEDYGKPKFHLGEHFGEVLGELGPFRHFNCLWGESYVQVLKAMFRITNWKSAPYDVAVHWATKSVMHYRSVKRGSWYEDVVTPSSEFHFDLKALQSPLANALLRSEHSVRSLRFVSEFRRGPETVCLNSWIIAEMPDVHSISARVDSIAQVTYSDTSASYIRIWCTQARRLFVDDEFTQWSERDCNASKYIIKLEDAQVRAVMCNMNSSHYVFV